MKTLDERKLAVVQLAWGGTSGEYLPIPGYGHCSSSGCGPLARYLAENGYDGMPVVIAPDEHGPMADAWIKTSIGGPMLNTKLGPTEVSRFDGRDNIVFKFMLESHKEGIRNGFTQLCAMAENENFSGLDEVGIDIWLATKRSAGARIGRMEGKGIRWEDGSYSEIPAEAYQENPKSWWPFWEWDKSTIPHKD